MANRAVFLDRDGIVNQALVREGKPYPPRSWEQFKFVPGIREALAEIKARGYKTVIVTNQPDLARGTEKPEVVEAFHSYISVELPIDKIYVCCHDDGDFCNCRKPKPGLILQASRDLKIDLTKSFMVGDRWRDVDAGNAAGCKTVFVNYGYREVLKTKPTCEVASVSGIVAVLDP